MVGADRRAHSSAAPLLVGRAREQSALREQFAAACDARGGLVLIGGEAGIGKTALAESLGASASEQGALVLVGHCYDLSETPPYGPWVELFGQYRQQDGLPSVPAAFATRGTVGEVASPAALFHQALDFLTALSARTPLLLLLDDLHWADPASLDLLRFIARNLATLPVLLVVTYRTDELTRRHPLYPLIPVLVREASAMRLDLRPLGAEDVAVFVGERYHLPDAEAARLVAYLHERSEGNPFFLGELRRTLEEERVLVTRDDGWQLGDVARVRVPPLLRQVIDGRLTRLGTDAQQSLAVAAVIGQEMPFALWAAIVGSDEATLLDIVEQATAAHLVEATSDGAGFRFVHALIREALYEGVLPLRRRGLHRQVGETLAAVPNADPDAVAYHFQQAGDARAVVWLVAVGERAQRAFAWLTAAERYEAAVALMPESGPEAGERGWLLYRISRMRRWESADRSIAYLDEALQIAEKISDRALSALLHFTRGIILYSGKSEFANGVADLFAGVEQAETLTAAERERLRPYEPALAIYPRIGLVLLYGVIGRHHNLLTLMEEEPMAFHAAVKAEEPATAVLIHIRSNIAIGYFMLGRSAEARAELAQDIAHFRATRNYQRLGQMLTYDLIRVLAYETDDVVGRQRLAQECEDAFQRARAIGGGFSVQHGWLPLLVLGGEWIKARSLIDRIHHDEVQMHLLEWFAVLMRAQGETERAWQLVQWSVPDGVTTEPGYVSSWSVQPGLRLASALCLDANDLPQARAWLEAHDRWLEWSGAVLGQSEGAALWAQYHRQTGDADHASACAQKAL
ncbi:MAG: ATP-binding protein, partial [Thermomicrobiales bacterium]